MLFLYVCPCFSFVLQEVSFTYKTKDKKDTTTEKEFDFVSKYIQISALHLEACKQHHTDYTRDCNRIKATAIGFLFLFFFNISQMFDSFYNNLHSLNNYIDYVPSEIAGRFYGLKEFKYLCCQKQSVMNTATPSHRTTAENTSFQGRILYLCIIS